MHAPSWPLGRRRSAGTLAIAGAVRAVDLICDAALGEHSVEPSHAVALDLLASVSGAENAVEDFSLCQTRKSEYNYHVSDIDDAEVVSVIEAAESLAPRCGVPIADVIAGDAAEAGRALGVRQ